MIVGRVATKRQSQLIRPSIVASLIAVAGFLALGLPGAIVLRAAMPVVGLFTRNELGPDQVWPAAIAIGLVGPFASVPAYLALASLVQSRWPRLMATIAFTLLIDILASAAVIVLAVA